MSLGPTVTSTELENLVAIGTLKREPCSGREFEALVRSGEARLSDAANAALAIESRFDLAYAEYEGVVDVDERLMSDLLEAARAVLETVRARTWAGRDGRRLPCNMSA